MTYFVVRNTNDQGTNSLRDAIEKANANLGDDTIVFTDNLANSIIHLTSGSLNITDPLTIIGPESGSITIDAGQKSRVISIDDANYGNQIAVSLKGLTITGGFASDALARKNLESTPSKALTANLGSSPRVDDANHGGGILNYENLTLVDCTIENNQAFDNGGGIENFATLTIKNSTIAKNRSHDGGGIYVDQGATVNILESNVINNISVDQGGGIANVSGNISIKQSTVTGNTAGTFGGGIDSIAGTIEIQGSIINNNTAVIHGGGIHGSSNSTISILMNSQINNNKAGIDGGGIKLEQGKITIANSVLAGNFTNFDGGGLDAEEAQITISYSTIDNNYAGDTGGGLRYVQGRGSLSINTSTISNNFAGRYGGGVGIGQGENASAFIYNSSIINNTALNEGGGISNFNRNKFILANSTVSENHSGNDGGGIANVGRIDIQNCTISDNSATDKGGGILNYGNLVLTNSIVANSSSGGDVYSYGSSISVRGKNIIEDGSVGGSGIINADPLLSPLQNNGGSMFTHIPLSGSPAINQGVNSLASIDRFDLDSDGNTTEPIPFDQRGQSYQRIVGGIIDLGAVEVSAMAASLPSVMANPLSLSIFPFIETIIPPLVAL